METRREPRFDLEGRSSYTEYRARSSDCFFSNASFSSPRVGPRANVVARGPFEAKVGGACRSKVRVANKASSGAALKGAVVTSKGAPVTRRKASSRLSPAKAAALCDEANTGEPEAPTLRR
jgi:hypothetical protein